MIRILLLLLAGLHGGALAAPVSTGSDGSPAAERASLLVLFAARPPCAEGQAGP